MVAVCVVVFASLQFSAPENDTMAVDVGGRAIPLSMPVPTVADALAAANVPVMPGALRAVVSGRVLVADATPATFTVNDRPAALETPLRRNDRVAMIPGTDTVEPVEERRVQGVPSGLPEVERALYVAGKPKIDLQVVGQVSGEVVSTTPVEPGAPAVPQTEKVVALTLDDGPDPKYTPDILRILAEEGVKATFCVVGTEMRRHPDLAREELAAGHARCNHTINHAHLPRLSHEGVVEQVKGNSDILTEIDGAAPTLFRPPYGELSPDAIAVVRESGMRVLTWNVDSQDYRKISADRILSNVMGAVKPGSVILLHDGGGDRSSTVAALRPMIRALKARGYSFATPLF